MAGPASFGFPWSKTYHGSCREFKPVVSGLRHGMTVCAWHALRSLDKLLKIAVNGRQVVNCWFLCHWDLISGFTHLFYVLFCGSLLLVLHELQSQHRPWYCLTLLLPSMAACFSALWTCGLLLAIVSRYRKTCLLIQCFLHVLSRKLYEQK